jgi:hypothetical protein
MSIGEENLKALTAIITAWKVISQDQIDDLIKSMPRQCAVTEWEGL